MDLVDLIESKRFLGHELLLWLWHHDDQHEGRFKLGDDYVELHFDDRIQLEASLAEAESSDLKGGSPAHSPEAHKALQVGKRVAKARLRLAKGEREWVFNVVTDTFRLNGIKTPAVLSKVDDEPFFERLFLIEELHDAWSGIYKLFLTARLGDDWEKSRAAIAAWIESPTGDEP